VFAWIFTERMTAHLVSVIITIPDVPLMLSDVCLSIGPKSRTERPRKTKIGTEVAHATRDSDTTFNVKRSMLPGRFTHHGVNASGSCSGDHGNVLTMGTYCYVAVCRRSRLGGARLLGTHRGRRGARAYCGCHPPTTCWYWILAMVDGAAELAAGRAGAGFRQTLTSCSCKVKPSMANCVPSLASF